MSFLGGIGGGPVLGDGLIRIGAVTSGLRGQIRGAVNDARAELNAGARSVQGTSQAWNKAFGVIGAAAKIGLAGVAIGVTAAIGASISFEKAWAGVRKTVDATPARLEKLRAEFRALAKEIPISVNELAGIGETAGALGVPTESILAFTKVVAELGSTTNVSSDQAATSLGQLSNVLKLTDKDYEKFGSTLVDLGNKGASTESQILDIASRAGAAGKLIGLSTPDILAWGSAVASLGIETEAGGSALQFFFLQASKVVNGVTKNGIPSAKALSLAQQKVRIATEGLTTAQKKNGAGSIQAQKASLALGNAQQALAKLTGTSNQSLDTMAKTAGLSAVEFKKLYGQDATKALSAFLTGLGKLPAAQQQAVLATLKLNNIRVIRAILGLANNAGELNRQLGVGEKAWEDNTALAAAAGKRYETTAAQLSILKNTIMDLFISVGDNALPVVKWLVKAFKEDIPKAAAYLSALVQSIWTRSLQPALLAMLGGFKTLGEGIASVLDFGGSQSQGDAIGTVFTGIGDAAGMAAKMIGAVASAIGELLKQPVIGGLAKAALIIGSISLALSGGAAVVGKLSGGLNGIVRALTFGKLGGSGVAATPLDGSAKALDGSAKALTEAAAALKGGAAGSAIEQASLGGIGAGFRGSGALRIAEGAGPAMTIASQEAQTAKIAFAETTAAGRAYARGLAQPLAGAEKAAIESGAYNQGVNLIKNRTEDITNGLKDGVNATRSKLGSAMSAVSGAIMPLIVADLAIEFLKAPIGDFVSNNTQFKRAGALMKEDFFGGLISLVQSWAIGSDAWVGHADVMTIGKSSFKTISLAKLGIGSATFDKLEAPAGTIERAQGEFESIPTVTKDLGQKAGEGVADWYKRIKDQLPIEFQKATDALLPTRARMKTDAMRAQDAANIDFIARSLAQQTGTQLRNLSDATRTDYLAALTDSLKSGGFTSGQVAQLSTQQLDTLSKVVQLDASGKYSFITDILTNTFLGTVSKSTRGAVTLSSDAKARIATLKKDFGKNWEAIAAAALPTPGVKQTAAQKANAKLLQKTFQGDWQGTVRAALADMQVSRAITSAGKNGSFAQTMADLGKQEKTVEAAIGSFFNTVPSDVKSAIDAIVSASGETDPGTIDAMRKSLEAQYHQTLQKGFDAFAADKAAIDPAIGKRLEKKFGADWVIAMRNGTGAITEKSVGKDALDELALRFGANWRTAIQGFGELLYEQQGGADAETLKKKLAHVIAENIAKIPLADLAGTGTKPPTKTQGTKDRKAVSDYLTSTVGLAALDAATSPDAAKAKKGFDDMGKALKGAIPDAAKRDVFIKTLVSLKQVTELPGLPTLDSFLKSAIPTAADAVGTLNSGVRTLVGLAGDLMRIVNGGGTDTGHRSSKTSMTAASGVVFDTGGETNITVGEAGKEHVAVLRNFRTMKLPKVPAAQSLVHDIVGGLRSAGGVPHGAVLEAAQGGARVQVVADKLQMFSDGDRRSVDAQLAFLAPDGR